MLKGLILLKKKDLEVSYGSRIYFVKLKDFFDGCASCLSIVVN